MKLATPSVSFLKHLQSNNQQLDSVLFKNKIGTAIVIAMVKITTILTKDE